MKPRARSLDPFANLQTFGGTPKASAVQPKRGLDPTLRPATIPATAAKYIHSHAPSKMGQSMLEARYPGMAHAITLLWGHPEMNAYFERIWMADQTQTPIHPDAMAELMLLARIHHGLARERPATIDSNQSMYGRQYDRLHSKDIWEDTRHIRRG